MRSLAISLIVWCLAISVGLPAQAMPRMPGDYNSSPIVAAKGGKTSHAKKKSSGKARSAKTGRYVTKGEATKHPATTVIEHDRATKK